jgi:hypothetical protein
MKPITQFRNKKGELIIGVGDLVAWDNLKGEHFEGIIIDTDNNVLDVKCQDGIIRSIEG